MSCKNNAECAYISVCAGHLQSAAICPLFRGQLKKRPLLENPNPSLKCCKRAPASHPDHLFDQTNAAKTLHAHYQPRHITLGTFK